MLDNTKFAPGGSDGANIKGGIAAARLKSSRLWRFDYKGERHAPDSESERYPATFGTVSHDTASFRLWIAHCSRSGLSAFQQNFGVERRKDTPNSMRSLYNHSLNQAR